MELKIVNPEATMFHEAVGISEQRSTELSRMLDRMANSFTGQIVSACDVMKEIAGYCENIEEYTYCILNHFNWHKMKYSLIV